MIDTTGTGATSTSTVSSVYADAQGTRRIIVEVSTQVWQVATADAFVWAAPVCITYNLRYPGQYFDAETGLTYNDSGTTTPQAATIYRLISNRVWRGGKSV